MEEPAVNNQIQQPNIPTPTEPKHRSFLTSKLFLITLIIVVLFTIVYAGIYLYLNSQLNQITKSSPTPLPAETSVKEDDPTANWKTYTNTKYNFSFKYPKDLSISPNSTNDFISFLATPNDNKSSTLRVSVRENPTNMDLQAFVEKNRPIPNDRVSYSYTKTTISGLEVLIETSELPCSGICKKGPVEEKGYAILIKVNKFVVYFAVSTYSQSKSPTMDENSLTQILSTFKLTPASPTGGDQGQTVCTQDAKLCPDGSYVSRQPPSCEFAKCP